MQNTEQPAVVTLQNNFLSVSERMINFITDTLFCNHNLYIMRSVITIRAGKKILCFANYSKLANARQALKKIIHRGNFNHSAGRYNFCITNNQYNTVPYEEVYYTDSISPDLMDILSKSANS